MRYKTVSVEEKRAELKEAGIPWPNCVCHDVPKRWKTSTTRVQGGTWRCAIRANQNRREATKRYREKAK